MLDLELRKFKDIILKPAAVRISGKISPNAVTIISFFAGLVCVFFTGTGLYTAALIFWVLNRTLDGLDGLIARLSDKKTDLGGFLDIFFDFIIYSGIPLGFALSVGTKQSFAAAAVLLAVFYINSALWMTVSALMEKHKVSMEQQTSMKMPRGLVEGFETIVFYSLMFIFPAKIILFSYLMAGMVTLGIFIRFYQAVGMLRCLQTEDN